jgi:hypothetical protein
MSNALLAPDIYPCIHRTNTVKWLVEQATLGSLRTHCRSQGWEVGPTAEQEVELGRDRIHQRYPASECSPEVACLVRQTQPVLDPIHDQQEPHLT